MFAANLWARVYSTPLRIGLRKRSPNGYASVWTRAAKDMKHYVTKELYAYWSRVRGARLAPERRDIDLLAMRSLLPNAFMVRVGKGAYPLEMCGTCLNAFWLGEQNGRSFLDLWATEDRNAAAAALASALAVMKPVVAGVRGGAAGLPAADMEMLLLPLRDSGKTHSLMLGALASFSEPAWLGRASIDSLRLASLRVVGQESAGGLTPAPERVRTPTAKSRALFLTVYEGSQARRIQTTQLQQGQ